MRLSDRGAVLPRDEDAYLHIHIIRVTEEEIYAWCLLSILRGNQDLADETLVTHSLDFDEFSCPYGTDCLLTDFVHSGK